MCGVEQGREVWGLGIWGIGLGVLLLDVRMRMPSLVLVTQNQTSRFSQARFPVRTLACMA